jgi:cell division protein FtsA
VIEVKSVGERPSRVASYSMLTDIIEPRASELIELLHAELGRAGCLKQLGSGLVLTGGGAKLGGLAPLAEQTLEMPVRVGVPQGLDKMGEILPDAGYSAVVGLVIYGNRLLLMRGPSDKGLVGKLWGALRGKN